MVAGTLEIQMQMDLARLSNDMHRAEQSVTGTMAKIGSAVESARNALLGLATAGTAGMLVAQMHAAMELADAMGKLAQRTGVAVEELTRMQYVARLSGVSTETMATGLKKLNISIAEAASGSKEQIGAFKALGISVTDASGRMKSADRIMFEMAEAFSNAEDGAGKTAVAVKVLGKAGDEMIPLLNAGGDEIRKLYGEADKLGAVIGKDFAKQSEAFNDNLERLKIASESWSKVLANDLLPALNVLGQALADNASGAEGMSLANRTLLTVMEAVILIGSDVAFVIKGIGIEIGGMAAQVAALMRGDWEGFKAIGEAMKANAKEARAELDRFQQSIVNAEKNARELREQRRQEDRGYNPFANQIKYTDDAADEAARKARAAAVKQAEDFIRKMNEEAQAVGLAKDQVRMLTAARAAALAPTAALRSEIMRTALTLDIAIKAEEEKAASEKKRIDTLEVLAKAEGAAAQARDEYTKTAAADLDKLLAESKALAERNRRIGLSVEAIGDLDAAKLEEQATTLEGIAIKRLDRDLDETAYNLLKAQADELRKIAALKRQGAMLEVEADTARKVAEEFQKTADSINHSLTDALMRGFESGKGFAKNFRDVLLNMFKTMVLRPVISAVLNPISLGIAGFMGMSGNAAASTGNSMSMVGGGLSLANGLAGGGGMMGGFMNGLGAWGSGGSVTGVLSNPGLYSGAELFGTVAPILGGLALLASLAKSFKGETRSGGQYGYSFDGSSAINARRGTSVGASGIGAVFLEGPSGGDPNQANALLGVNTAVGGINSRFAALGSSSRVTGFGAGYETSDKGRGGVFAGGTLTGGMTFGESGKGDNYAGTLFETTSTQSPDSKAAWENFTTDLLQASIQALQADATLPESVKKLVKDVNAEALSMDAATQLLAQVDMLIAGVSKFKEAVGLMPFEDLQKLSFDAAAALIELAGGIENLNGQLGSYYQNFYTEEERRAQQMVNITKVLDKANVVMPKSNAEFRALVEHYMAMGESGQVALAALLSVNQAFAELYPIAGQTTEAIDKLAEAAEEFNKALDDALSALKRAVDAEKERLSIEKMVHQEALAAAKAVYDIAHSNAQQLYGMIPAAAVMGAMKGREFISNAAFNASATGYLPDATALSEAVSAARIGLDSRQFKTLQEQQEATIKLANDLASLEQISGAQKTIEEQQLDAIEAQIKALDDLYDQQEKLVQAAQGIDVSVLSVADALQKLTDLMFPNAGKPTETLSGTPMSGGPSTAAWNGRAAGTQVGFSIDANGYRSYSDGSGSYLSEGEMDLWKRGLLGNVPMPSFDVGTAYIPMDGPAWLHEGEAVLPAPVAQRWRDTQDGASTAYLASIDRRMANVEASNEAIAIHVFGTKKNTKEMLDRGVAIDQTRTGPLETTT